MDGNYDGKPRALTHLDVLEAFGPKIKASGTTKLFINGDVSAELGDKLVAEDKVDAIVIGRSFINNPDLVKRLFNHLPLNETLGEWSGVYFICRPCLSKDENCDRSSPRLF